MTNKLKHTPTPCQGPECKDILHKSDCSVHNAPASPAGPCDCYSELPWKVCLNGSIIRRFDASLEEDHIAQTFGPNAQANAAFICRAVNSHEIMYEALQACLNSEYVDQYGTHIPVIKGELRQQIAQAIAKAEGSNV